MSKKNYVVVEGVIGVGKTTLTNYLCESWDAKPVHEVFEENPFLEDFYRDRRRYAFQTQITFLLSRYQQQEKLLQRDIFSPRIVSDYLFQKDRIFANINLNDKELGLYEKLFPIVERDVPVPDLVVYLQASSDVLLQRIDKRGRAYEKDMDPEYIQALNDAYNYFFFHYDATPLLVVDTNHLNFVDSEEHRLDLIQRIEEHTGGTTYYRPLDPGA
ncbi:MAG: deoxynucleoside kinase [Candidatus Eisenbacteria bacterium]|uniref:Deoxynucleoside kinase n=1 Tax=Eiseniibacteriota bacterium TaxID=2212470 RepID=A0A7Y2H3C3_UNCEI|nr:deoxynucleoside kinase [Candidatus Eisenbacteria bacterium]